MEKCIKLNHLKKKYLNTVLAVKRTFIDGRRFTPEKKILALIYQAKSLGTSGLRVPLLVKLHSTISIMSVTSTSTGSAKCGSRFYSRYDQIEFSIHFKKNFFNLFWVKAIYYVTVALIVVELPNLVDN